MTGMNTQNGMILRDLEEGKTITPLTAIKDYHCMRLAARIWDLRQQGHVINKSIVHSGDKQWAEYKMAQANDNQPAPVK